MTFKLHPDLDRDGIFVGKFELCQALLINDSTFPWFVLVPERESIRDVIDLSEADDQQLWRESRVFSQAIMNLFQGEKLNVAALGNMTPQLHVHHVVRFSTDAAWPGPIWGRPLVTYQADAIADIKLKLASSKIEGFVAASNAVGNT